MRVPPSWFCCMYEGTVDMLTVSWRSFQSSSSGAASSMEPTQMMDSLEMMDWQGSTLGFCRALGAMAALKRSILRAQRLKVATPSELTCKETKKLIFRGGTAVMVRAEDRGNKPFSQTFRDSFLVILYFPPSTCSPPDTARADRTGLQATS